MDPNTHAFAPTVDSEGRVIGVDLVRKDNSAVVVSPDLEPWEDKPDEEHSDVEAALAALRRSAELPMGLAIAGDPGCSPVPRHLSTAELAVHCEVIRQTNEILATSDDGPVLSAAELAESLAEQRAEGRGLPTYDGLDSLRPLLPGEATSHVMCPADGSTWEQWRRRNSIITAALVGGATNAEALRLAQLDRDYRPEHDEKPGDKDAYLRDQFAEMVGERVTGRSSSAKRLAKRHSVAKRYRARGRW